jgi:hypothetical protein
LPVKGNELVEVDVGNPVLISEKMGALAKMLA